jgi:hypothetical protein
MIVELEKQMPTPQLLIQLLHVHLQYEIAGSENRPADTIGYFGQRDDESCLSDSPTKIRTRTRTIHVCLPILAAERGPLLLDSISAATQTSPILCSSSNKKQTRSVKSKSDK